MTETIQQLKEDIAILQEKLQKLEEKEPDMMLLRQGKVDFVDYNHRTHYRIEYTDSFSGVYKWFVRKLGEVAFLEEIRDVNVYAPLEELYQKEVVKQKEEYPYKKYTPEKTEKLQEKNWYVDAKTLLKSKEPEKWDVVRESVKWCEEHREESVEDYLTPQERGDRIHKEVENEIEKLQEKNWYVDGKDLIKEWGEKNKPPTLYEILMEWWINHLDMEQSDEEIVDGLVDMIDKKFIPPSRDRNGYEWEKCLKMMRDKLR